MSAIETNTQSQSQNSHCYNKKNNFSAHNNLALSSGGQDKIDNNCPDQKQNCANEIEIRQTHHIYSKPLTNNILNIQETKEAPRASIKEDGFSEIHCDNKNGITPEAKNICPTLANIPESTLTCSLESLGSINYNCNTLRNDVKGVDGTGDTEYL